MNEEEILKRLRVLQASIDYLVDHLLHKATMETVSKFVSTEKHSDELVKAYEAASKVGHDFYAQAKLDAEKAPD